MASIKKKEGFFGQRSIVIPAAILAQQCEAAPIIRELYITAIGYYPHAEHHYRHRTHGVNEHILIYCTAGRGMVKMEGKKYPVSAGSLAIIPANTPHEYAADENAPWTIYWTHFKGANSFDFVNMMLDKLGSPVSSIPYNEDRVELFDGLYNSIERGYSRNNIGFASIGLQYFLSSCCFFENYQRQPKEQGGSIDNCISFMQQHVDQILTLQEIAASVHLSASHLAALFRKKTGYSVIEYFNHLKVQQACQYLQFTSLRVNEISEKLGISDPYYFSRMFTKIAGCSPLKYRSTYQVTPK